MTNIRLKSISESQDVETITGWKEAQKNEVTENEFLKVANYSGRDHGRTPMQWDASANAGFSKAMPWMTVNPNKEHIHVAEQHSNHDSILNYFKKMREIRKSNPVFVYGSYEPVEIGNENLFTFYRVLDKEKFMIVLNFSSEKVNLSSDTLPDSSRRVIGNYSQTNRTSIQPWEANVFKL